MIGYLEGTIRGNVLVTSSGVGYIVNTITPLVQGSAQSLFVTTVVREDAIILYGFLHDQEREVFEALCKVTGVGPSSALAVLRDAGIRALQSAVAIRNAKPLGKIKGVGPKIADRIVTELKLSNNITSPSTSLSDIEQDLLNVLVELGYDRSDIITAIAVSDQDSPEELRLSQALAYLREDR
jgi:Holliday junction DNA helicase RuvA